MMVMLQYETVSVDISKKLLKHRLAGLLNIS